MLNYQRVENATAQSEVQKSETWAAEAGAWHIHWREAWDGLFSFQIGPFGQLWDS